MASRMADDSDIVWLSDQDSPKETVPIPSSSKLRQDTPKRSPEISIVEDSFLRGNALTLTPTRSSGESRRNSRKRASFDDSFGSFQPNKQIISPVLATSLPPSKNDSFTIEDSFLNGRDNFQLASTPIDLAKTLKKTPSFSIVEDSFGGGFQENKVSFSPSLPTTSRNESPDLIILDDSIPSKEAKKRMWTPPSDSSSVSEEKENSQSTALDRLNDKNEEVTVIPSPKKKRQNKEESEAERSEKEAKAIERERKRQIRQAEIVAKTEEKEAKQRKRLEEKQQKEVEKKRARIEREIQASTKSHAEKYLFCHVRRSILEKFDGLEAALRCAFMDRELEKQLKIVENDEKLDLIEFHRGYIDITEKDDGDVDRFEYQEIQSFFVFVTSGETLTNDYKNFATFVEKIKLSLSLTHSNLVITCLGQPKVSANKLFSLNIDLFASLRAQLKICDNADAMAHYLVQITKGLAKFNPRSSHSRAQFQDGVKGIRDGPDLVENWWSLMLSRIYRLSDASRRAIIGKIPTPVKGIDWIRDVGVDAATKEIANLMGENNRRVGVAMAVRLVRMLSDKEGTAVVE